MELLPGGRVYDAVKSEGFSCLAVAISLLTVFTVLIARTLKLKVGRYSAKLMNTYWG